MADTTKKQFHEILNYIAGPVVKEGHIVDSYLEVWYAEVLLGFSGNVNHTRERLKAGGVNVYMSGYQRPRVDILLAVVRYDKHEDETWEKRFRLKMDKYHRWLAEWEGNTNGT